MQSDCSFNIIQKYWSEIPVKLQSFECSQHTLVLVSNDESSSSLWLPDGVASPSCAVCWADDPINAWSCSFSWHLTMSLFVFRIPGVFPESPRWLLLSERTGDMNSFSERSERQRDDDSFSGQFKNILLENVSRFVLEGKHSFCWRFWSNISSVLKEQTVHCCVWCRVGHGVVLVSWTSSSVFLRAAAQQKHLEKPVCAGIHVVSHSCWWTSFLVCLNDHV